MQMIRSNDAGFTSSAPLGALAQRSYLDALGALWENKRELPYAWSILKRGICEACSLGSPGLRDDVVGGLHLCAGHLKMLRLNTLSAFDMSAVKDVRRLEAFQPEKLYSLGRVAHPMVRRKNAPGFTQIRWEEAFAIIANAIRNTAPHELGFCAASRGLTNEVYYAFQKLARVLGTNNIDSCRPSGHDSVVAGLKNTLGVTAPTCSLSDLIDADLLVILDPALMENQPATTKYLDHAKKRGTRIVVLNAIPPSVPERLPPALTSLDVPAKPLDANRFNLRHRGEVAFINGVIKALLEWNRIDHQFVSRHTAGFGELKTALAEQSWEMLESRSGTARQEMERFAALYASVSSAVFVMSAERAQHESSTDADAVKAVVNLVLARGMIGREKCGIMSVSRQSGAQGGSDCGIAPDHFPGGFDINHENARRLSNLWRHPVSSAPGLKLQQIMAAAHAGRMKFIYSIGCNLLDTMADRAFVAEALSQVAVRIHQETVLNPSVLVDSAQAVLVLPAQTRYEQQGGGTSTTSERKIRFTPALRGHTIGESLPAWWISTIIGRRSMPNGELLFPFTDTQSIRDEMARVMPIYQGIEMLRNENDYLQWGGPHLFKGGNFRGMPGERALFSPLQPPERDAAADILCDLFQTQSAAREAIR